MLLRALLLAALCAAPASSSVDCSTIIEEGYQAILTRASDAGGLKGKVAACTAKTPWPPTSGPMAGKPWSPGGMVYEMRNAPEYDDKKLTPMQEKGGCRFCKLTAKGLGGEYCTVAVLPPDDSTLLDCVLNVNAQACCAPSAFTWGWAFLLFLIVGGGLYAAGGVAYNVHTSAAPPLTPQPLMLLRLVLTRLDGVGC